MDHLPRDRSAAPTILAEWKELFSDYNHHLSTLFERIQEQLKVISAELADISQRLPRRQ